MARKVTSEEFYKVIGDLDVTVTPKGEFPYRTDFCYRYGGRVGYAQPIDKHGFLEEYYLEDHIAKKFAQKLNKTKALI